MTNSNLESKLQYIISWLENILKKTKAAGFVFGLSGGIDSALIAYILSKYFKKEQSLALTLNIYNSSKDVNDAKKIIADTGINHLDIPLEKTFEVMKDSINISDSLILGNVKSRLRAVTLYSFAQKNNFLVVGTSNADEYYTGYFTKYGDSASDILPLVNLTKSDIYALAWFLKVPDEILAKKPSAGLFDGQSDEDDLKVTYQEIDNFLMGKKVSKISENRIKHLYTISNHKRKMPPSPLKKGKLIFHLK